MISTEILAQLNRPKKRYQKQQDSIVERTDGFYIRFYADHDGVRTRDTEPLCDLSITDPHKRELLAASRMAAINNTRHTALRSQTPPPALAVGTFWTATYWPWVKANRRFSTSRGYEKLRHLYLKNELNAKILSRYTTLDANEFLTKLAGKLTAILSLTFTH